MIEGVFVQVDGMLWNSALYRGAHGETRVACGRCGRDLGPVDTLSVGGTACRGCRAVVSICTRCRMSFEALDEAAHRGNLPSALPPDAYPTRESLPVSDCGIDGARPLPDPTWNPWADPLSDDEWSEQNRKINDLLEGRGTP